MEDEYVVFCKPSALQERAYMALLQSQGLKNCLYQDDMSSHLKAITLMRKLCNGVSLVSNKVESVQSRQCAPTDGRNLMTRFILPCYRLSLVQEKSFSRHVTPGNLQSSDHSSFTSEIQR